MGGQDFWVVIFVIGFCFQAQILSSQNLTCNLNDLKALEEFMGGLQSVIGDWGKNFSADCCEWAGITCNSSSSLGLNDSVDTHRVVELDVSSKKIIGNLSESLGNLEQLRALNLSHNFLKNSLPASLFQLPNLKYLDLSSNDFSGPIPVDINLPSLLFLDISQNFLNGSIPQSICASSTRLQVLKLAVNYLSGTLPASLGNCSSLEDLCLLTNNLSGGVPEGIYQLQNLVRLTIQDNKLTGPLSKEVGNLINLNRLDISTNWFSGSIPDVFHSLGRLQYFVAHSNNFSGGIPPSLSSSPNISLLNVRNNSLEGPIDLNCSAMTSLASLDLGSNQFAGVIPSNLPSCRHLNNINLARNNLSGPIPDSFKDFHTLNYLSLSNSSHSNLSSALQILQQCKNLTTLVLTMNFYDEKLPADPTIHFAKLKVFIIANSRLIGSIPQWLSKSSRLQLLDISWNYLEGTVPAWFGNFTNLFYLDISNNSFTGDIPRSLTGLQSLIYWNVSKVQEPSPDFPLFQKKNVSARGLQYNQVWSFPPTLALGNNYLTQGAARGLAYLHQSCEPHIVHRDIKSSNILLDENFKAHLADFGLARLLLPYDTHVTTDLVGTLGYIPPEYGQASVATYKGDVYSFGVVLLELLTGKRPMDMCKPKGARDLISWVFQMKRERRETEVFDPVIYDKQREQELLCVFEIALLCLSGCPKVRPSTQQLVSWLDNINIKI
ncbi:putative protein kinase RLK-Pelle-LRR-Xb-1 family [Rosa chinensis]|uniref:non-specific serine/threonine protein kinase n=1 Tax=Rosa chinensis TaxID=74649 RepID=A0A2P6R4K8_ROSCH|nr:putative protein kinase RLK-Pelle-LRR-Xb-1 family [Rosa chinensis]